MEYRVLVKYLQTGEEEILELTTEDLRWSMEQYQRNRSTFTWEVLE